MVPRQREICFAVLPDFHPINADDNGFNLYNGPRHRSVEYLGDPMQVGLFIPCYIDQFYPHAGMATVRVLEQHGVTVDFPTAQTCCGQPMANVGCTEETRPLAAKFCETFKEHEYIVCPSGSCVAMVRHHYHEYAAGIAGLDQVGKRTYELCEFLVDVVKVQAVAGRFPHKVGLHQSCHGLRELRLASSSELVGTSFGKARQLLSSLQDIEITQLRRPDECCGFGGTFAVDEEAVSCMMGEDRIDDHLQAGTEVLTSVDMSCLMHLDGLIRRQNVPIRVMHIAEILSCQQQ